MTVSISTVGDSGFTTLYTLAEVGASNTVLEVVLSNIGGGILTEGSVVATGVDAIRFDFAAVSVASNDWSGYREFDVIGSATPIPEPSAALLGGLGILAVLRRRS